METGARPALLQLCPYPLWGDSIVHLIFIPRQKHRPANAPTLHPLRMPLATHALNMPKSRLAHGAIAL